MKNGLVSGLGVTNNDVMFFLQRMPMLCVRDLTC